MTSQCVCLIYTFWCAFSPQAFHLCMFLFSLSAYCQSPVTTDPVRSVYAMVTGLYLRMSISYAAIYMCKPSDFWPGHKECVFCWKISCMLVLDLYRVELYKFLIPFVFLTCCLLGCSCLLELLFWKSCLLIAVVSYILLGQ